MRVPFHASLPFCDGAVELWWNSEGKVIGLGWAQTTESEPEPQTLSLVPWGVDRLLCELKSFFQTGAPMGPVPWDLIDQSGWSEWQLSVYQAIARIPHGQTRTYGWVANRLQKPAAGRAVGQALKNNPVAILIPCHRVVATATLGGFMGVSSPNAGAPGHECAELKLKRKLLNLEEEFLNPIFPFLAFAEAVG